MPAQAGIQKLLNLLDSDLAVIPDHNLNRLLDKPYRDSL